jgi:dephospho-CoA kinase
VALHVFALTGGIGSGKSTVAAHYRALGLPVVDADRLARDVVEPGTVALAELVEAFGPDILDTDGRLDRPGLASHVFGNTEARRVLEAIVHPRVREAARAAFARVAESGTRLACYEVPLLFETGQEDNYRPVVLVTAKPETQIARAMLRDKSQEAAVRARIAAQHPQEDKIARADYVIHNDGPRETTLAEAERILRDIRARWVKPTA